MQSICLHLSINPYFISLFLFTSILYIRNFQVQIPVAYIYKIKLPIEILVTKYVTVIHVILIWPSDSYVARPQISGGGGRGHQISERKTRTDERHEQTGMSRTWNTFLRKYVLQKRQMSCSLVREAGSLSSPRKLAFWLSKKKKYKLNFESFLTLCRSAIKHCEYCLYIYYNYSGVLSFE